MGREIPRESEDRDDDDKKDEAEASRQPRRNDDSDDDDEQDEYGEYDFEDGDDWEDPSDGGVLGQVLVAAEDGNAELLSSLLGSLTVGLDTLGPEGDTPLHLASLYGHENCVEELLKAGANPGACDEAGGTPLHDASAGGFVNIVKRLLGACPTALNEVDSDGDTPLHCAARGGHVDCVAVLLEAGADADARNFSEQTPLMLVEPGDTALRALFGDAE